MKLVNHLTIRLSGIFILIMLIWSAIYFAFQMNEIYDGIDEGLNNLKQEFILKANKSENFVSIIQEYSPLNMIVEEISEDEALIFEEVYSTTKVYFPTEEENEEVRMLTTVFKCELDGNFYKLKFFTSTVESDDLIKNMLYLLISLWICLGLALVFVSKRIINKTNKPFHQLLDNLKGFQLNNTRMINLPQTSINEYKELNESVRKLLEENIAAYTEQKRFIENASHELQTPLAIAINKLELLSNNTNLSEAQFSEIELILNRLNWMKRMNSSLLLLSKIENKQYSENKDVNLAEVFDEVISNFEDLIEYKNINLVITRNGIPCISMNPDLAYIMATNLIKNAITYNKKGGTIEVKYNTLFITISNDGDRLQENIDIFQRYVFLGNRKQSSGLGLSIVKSIVDSYNMDIQYLYKEKHIIKLLLNQ